MLERIKRLTRDEIKRLDNARDAVWDEDRRTSRGAPRYLAWSRAEHAAWDAAWDADRDTVWDEDEGPYEHENDVWLNDCQAAKRAAKQDAVSAVSAVSARHLISQHGFTLEHYNILTKPWRDVIGEFGYQP